MTETSTKNLLWKLWQAKIDIASTKISKEGTNDFSHYDYFTPEQVNKIVQKVCNEQKLFTKFDLKRNEWWVYWVLTIYDIESEESISFEWATAIPEIKATNIAQQIWGCMTYTERYLKMTAFGICDNSLDFDTTENTQKTAENKEKKTEKATNKNDLPRFNEEEFEMLKKNTTWVKEKQSSDELIKSLLTKYRLSNEMKRKVADLRGQL